MRVLDLDLELACVVRGPHGGFRFPSAVDFSRKYRAFAEGVLNGQNRSVFRRETHETASGAVGFERAAQRWNLAGEQRMQTMRSIVMASVIARCGFRGAWHRRERPAL